jgi:hypothetical protein
MPEVQRGVAISIGRIHGGWCRALPFGLYSGSLVHAESDRGGGEWMNYDVLV